MRGSHEFPDLCLGNVATDVVLLAHYETCPAAKRLACRRKIMARTPVGLVVFYNLTKHNYVHDGY